MGAIYFSRWQFQRNGRGFTTTHAKGGDAAAQTMVLQGMEQRHDDPGTRGANRVPQRAGAAVNVHTLQANTQLLRHGQNTECKAFADFKEINRARFPSSLGQ